MRSDLSAGRLAIERHQESMRARDAMMTAPGESREWGLVAWGGSALRRFLWWRDRRRAARQAVRQAVQLVLGR